MLDLATNHWAAFEAISQISASHMLPKTARRYTPTPRELITFFKSFSS